MVDEDGCKLQLDAIQKNLAEDLEGPGSKAYRAWKISGKYLEYFLEELKVTGPRSRKGGIINPDSPATVRQKYSTYFVALSLEADLIVFDYSLLTGESPTDADGNRE